MKEIFIEKFDSLFEYFESFSHILPELFFVLVVLIATFFISKLMNFVVKTSFSRTRLKKPLIEFMQKIIIFLVWLAGILFSASILFPSVTPAKVLTALGFGTIAIGFAFKDIFENFMAGILILIREPFKIKDCIEVDGLTGFVNKITIRDTYIKDLDGQRVVVPNAKLFKNIVTVQTFDKFRRVIVDCGIAYSEDVESAKKLLLNEIKKLESVSQDHPIEVRADNFGDSSVNLKIYWYTGSHPESVRISVDEVVTHIKKILDDAKIEIPFPYRTLTFQKTPEFKVKS